MRRKVWNAEGTEGRGKRQATPKLQPIGLAGACMAGCAFTCRKHLFTANGASSFQTRIALVKARYRCRDRPQEYGADSRNGRADRNHPCAGKSSNASSSEGPRIGGSDRYDATSLLTVKRNRSIRPAAPSRHLPALPVPACCRSGPGRNCSGLPLRRPNRRPRRTA